MGIKATIIHIRLIFALVVVICTAHLVQGCGENQFRCANGGCIGASYKCDGDEDCQDGSDETSETCGANCGGMEGRFACSNGQCIQTSWKCDGDNDCGDGSDETTEACSAICIERGGWACSDGQCIEAEHKCSGSKDCRDGSDETTAICGANCEELRGGPFPSNVRIQRCGNLFQLSGSCFRSHFACITKPAAPTLRRKPRNLTAEKQSTKLE